MFYQGLLFVEWEVSCLKSAACLTANDVDDVLEDLCTEDVGIKIMEKLLIGNFRKLNERGNKVTEVFTYIKRNSHIYILIHDRNKKKCLEIPSYGIVKGPRNSVIPKISWKETSPKRNIIRLIIHLRSAFVWEFLYLAVNL